MMKLTRRQGITAIFAAIVGVLLRTLLSRRLPKSASWPGGPRERRSPDPGRSKPSRVVEPAPFSVKRHA